MTRKKPIALMHSQNISNILSKMLLGMVYSGVFTIIVIIFNLLWRYASQDNRLLDKDADGEEIHTITRQYLFGLLLYFITFLVAIVSLPISLIINVLLAIFFAIPTRNIGAKSKTQV